MQNFAKLTAVALELDALAGTVGSEEALLILDLFRKTKLLPFQSRDLRPLFKRRCKPIPFTIRPRSTPRFLKAHLVRLLQNLEFAAEKIGPWRVNFISELNQFLDWIDLSLSAEKVFDRSASIFQLRLPRRFGAKKNFAFEQLSALLSRKEALRVLSLSEDDLEEGMSKGVLRYFQIDRALQENRRKYPSGINSILPGLFPFRPRMLFPLEQPQKMLQPEARKSFIYRWSVAEFLEYPFDPSVKYFEADCRPAILRRKDIFRCLGVGRDMLAILNRHNMFQDPESQQGYSKEVFALATGFNPLFSEGPLWKEVPLEKFYADNRRRCSAADNIESYSADERVRERIRDCARKTFAARFSNSGSGDIAKS